MDIGLIYIIIAELFWATEIIIIRKYFPTVNSFFLAAIGSIIGSLFYVPVLLANKQKLSFNNWIIVIIYALTTWFLAQMFYVLGIQKSNNSMGITFSVLSLSLFTLIFSWIFLKEIITLKSIIGGIVMIVGFLIISL
jgi:transporter family protein